MRYMEPCTWHAGTKIYNYLMIWIGEFRLINHGPQILSAVIQRVKSNLVLLDMMVASERITTKCTKMYFLYSMNVCRMNVIWSYYICHVVIAVTLLLVCNWPLKLFAFYTTFKTVWLRWHLIYVITVIHMSKAVTLKSAESNRAESNRFEAFKPIC